MKWFVLEKKEIFGPFDKSYIVENFDDDSLVWGPELDEWVPKRKLNLFAKKNTQQPSLIPTAKSDKPSHTSPLHSSNTSENMASPPAVKWHYTTNGEKFGPFSHQELSQIFKVLQFNSQVYVWNKSFSNWKKLEDCPELLESLQKTAA